jgi:uncharacterized membrane protein
MRYASAALLASAFLHALWNALLKRERDPQRSVAGVLAVALVLAAAAAVTAPAPAFRTGAAFAWAALAGVFEGVYFVTLAAALARADYGTVYTVARGGAMVLVWPASPLFLGEPVSARGALGAAVVAGGLALVATVRGRPRVARAGLAFALACAGGIAGYHLCYDRALAAGARPSPLFAVALAIALPFVAGSLRARGPLAGSRPTPRELLRWTIAGVLCTASFLLFLSGLAASGAAVALTLRNTSVVFAQGLSFALGERPRPAQVIGAVLVAVGAALVTGA